MKLVYKDSIYSISKVKPIVEGVEPKYVVWKELHKGNGYICKGIYQGTKEQCKSELNKIKRLKKEKRVSEDYEIGV